RGDPIHSALLRSLQEVRTPESSALLVQRLLTETRESTVGSTATRGLTAEGLRTLRQEATNPQRPLDVRRRLIRTLGCARDYQSIALLSRMARGAEDELARAALEALATIGGIQAL